MNEFKGTPGPWEVTNSTGGYAADEDDSHFSIATQRRDDFSRYHLAVTVGDLPELAQQEKANAHMLAASWDMWQALKAFMNLPHLDDDVCEKGAGCKVCEAIESGKAALAKAVHHD